METSRETVRKMPPWSNNNDIVPKIVILTPQQREGPGNAILALLAFSAFLALWAFGAIGFLGYAGLLGLLGLLGL